MSINYKFIISYAVHCVLVTHAMIGNGHCMYTDVIIVLCESYWLVLCVVVCNWHPAWLWYAAA